MIKNLGADAILNLAAFIVALAALAILALAHGLAPAANLASVDSIATTIAGGCFGFVSRGAVRPAAPPAA